jgi:hypothetical protein
MENIDDIYKCDPCLSVRKGELVNDQGITTPIVDDCL